jgi:AcrR family transcriptional regulator
VSTHRQPVQERSRRTRDSLLDAAGELLGEVGIERISTNLICERAGVTPPAFYRYFEDKYAIVEALAVRLMKRQNVVLEAWVAEHREAGLEAISGDLVELMRRMHAVTGGSPEGLWVMRALRAIPKLTHIRLASHNYVADLLTDLCMPHLPHVPREVVRRRTRMSVEMAYSLDEMLKEGEAEAEPLFADAAHVFKATFRYPDFER